MELTHILASIEATTKSREINVPHVLNKSTKWTALKQTILQICGGRSFEVSWLMATVEDHNPRIWVIPLGTYHSVSVILFSSLDNSTHQFGNAPFGRSLEITSTGKIDNALQAPCSSHIFVSSQEQIRITIFVINTHASFIPYGSKYLIREVFGV